MGFLNDRELYRFVFINLRWQAQMSTASGSWWDPAWLLEHSDSSIILEIVSYVRPRGKNSSHEAFSETMMFQLTIFS